MTLRIRAELCPIVEGVWFELPGPSAAARGLVPSNTLESCFGAGPFPEEWLSCFRRHEEEIVARAMALREGRPGQSIVVVREHHFDCDDG